MFNKEVFQENLIYILDTKKNRELVIELLGDKPKFDIGNDGYIIINTDTKNWRSSFGFEWLYRNTPPKIDITISDTVSSLLDKSVVARNEYKNKHNI